MSLAALGRALPAGDRVLLDSTSLIAYLNNGERVSPAAIHVIDQLVKSGRNPAVVSMVSVMECLIRPIKKGPEAYDNVLDFLAHFPNLKPQVIDLAVAQEAAGIRATFDFSPPDSLVIATGVIAQVGHLVTNDLRWKRQLQGRRISKRIKVVYLEDFIPL